jgi:hypothetical protein
VTGEGAGEGGGVVDVGEQVRLRIQLAQRLDDAFTAAPVDEPVVDDGDFQCSFVDRGVRARWCDA